jgi:hypothetical protein
VKFDIEAHEIVVTRWHRMVPLRFFVRDWKIGPSRCMNQELANVRLGKPVTSAKL